MLGPIRLFISCRCVTLRNNSSSFSAERFFCAVARRSIASLISCMRVLLRGVAIIAPGPGPQLVTVWMSRNRTTVVQYSTEMLKASAGRRRLR